ncbi:teichoic acid transport system permease protein [Butyrivibrio proteoclasticus]|uniref:Transport permease protein n=1 Tax=Butyrivibrio proteoclasticus TaxID=43305 RepID=A0A1I5PVN9_9FIRM|nr:ABC transporter permease [Butyrivibrio proteoclasticus]SFP37997.1 teichoic acid transport system permease protein [Butyrivibrio proteoclasticus]
MKKKKIIAAVIIILAAVISNIFLAFNIHDRISMYISIFLCLLIDALGIYCLRNIETIFRVPLDIYRSRDMFWDLAKNDFQAKFVGSIFGVFWAFVNPIITLLLYWFVFQVGLRSGNVGDYPFILFLMSGLIPWFYVQEALNGGASSLMEYSYLVKKMVFNVGILPVLKVVSALFVHVFFLAFLLLVACVYGIGIDLYTVQIFYYIFASAFLILGLSYFSAASTAFFKDMTQIINILLVIGTWLTPIMWNAEATLSPALLVAFKINPFFYIIDGFRDAILYKRWFWDKPVWTAYFWIVAIAIYIGGVKFFNRLKVHFSDVL